MSLIEANGRATATDQPMLSILMPAYNYPQGIARTLSMLASVQASASVGGQVEIRVSDDSSDAAAADAIRCLIAAVPGAIYHHNDPPLGAPGNWNGLLEQARGRYCWLIHHDEWPGDPQLASDLLTMLSLPDAVDAVVLPCFATRRLGVPAREHFPARWLQQVLRRHPHYLLRRNLLGAPSMIVLRRSLYPRFDPGLRWFVDTELYLRIFGDRLKVRVVENRCVLSLIRPTSITASIGADLGPMKAAERAYLHRKLGGTSRAWWITGSSWRARAVRAMEQGAWLLVRTAASLHARRQAGRRTVPEDGTA